MRRYENVSIDKLIPYENNAKMHDKKQIEQVAKSIDEFGFINPILIDENYQIIAGHCRTLSAKHLGMTEVPCLFVEDLTDEQKRAYVIADNRMTELGEWDKKLLEIELEALEGVDFDISLTGFDWDDLWEGDDDFSMDDFDEIDGYNSEEDDRAFFTKTFTFPIEKKKKIICYLKKYQNEIIEQIIKEAERDD